MVLAGCPQCGHAVSLHEGRPAVTGGGAVQVWHRSCWDHRAQPITPSAPVPIEALVAPRARRTWKPGHTVGVLGVLGVLGAGAWLLHTEDARASLANIEIRSAEPVEIGGTATRADDPPPRVKTLAELHPMPTFDGEPIDQVFSSLAGWTHPVTDSPELVPTLWSRKFGASRAGIERDECGDGHCGVDLDGPRGRPLVAVAAGVVIRVERKELGADGRSGRYVRLQHDDGALTAYMHLDEVATALEVGDRVRGGQYIGTLGATAVYSAPPHLHFSIEVPIDPAQRGDHTATRYLDPAPFLARSTIVPIPERRHAIKPAS